MPIGPALLKRLGRLSTSTAADTTQTIRREDPEMGRNRAIEQLGEKRRECDPGALKTPNSASDGWKLSGANRPQNAVTAVRIRSGVPLRALAHQGARRPFGASFAPVP